MKLGRALGLREEDRSCGRDKEGRVPNVADVIALKSIIGLPFFPSLFALLLNCCSRPEAPPATSSRTPTTGITATRSNANKQRRPGSATGPLVTGYWHEDENRNRTVD